jgi:hypothetical protein
MLFYSALFVASIVVAVVILWIFQSLSSVGKAVYQAFLPSSKGNLGPAAHLDSQRLTTTINDVPMPWGWKGGSNPSQVARATAASPGVPAPWGWSGEKNKARELKRNNAPGNPYSTTRKATNKQEKEKPSAYREESFDFAGKTYKVKRARKLRKTHLKNMGKPWGW